MLLQAANFGYLGLFFGISVLIGYLMGTWADRRLHCSPWLSLLGVLCGIAAGFRELFRLMKQYQREQRRNQEPQDPKEGQRP